MIKSTLRLLMTALAALLLTAPKSMAQEVVWGSVVRLLFRQPRIQKPDNQLAANAIRSPHRIPNWVLPWDGTSFADDRGSSLLANFGAKPFQTDNEIFGYYQYNAPKFKALRRRGSAPSK